MNTNMVVRDWCDDERSTIHNISHMDKSNSSFYRDVGCWSVLRDIARGDWNNPASLQWNEMEYTIYEYEPLAPSYQVPANETASQEQDQDPEDQVNTNVVDKEKLESPDHFDLTYQGLVKNKFMYA